MTACPELKELEQLINGALTGDARNPVAEHVHGCAGCLQILEGMAEDAESMRWRELIAGADSGQPTKSSACAGERTPPDFLARLAKAPPATQSAVPETFEPWPVMPGFEILEVAGSGGMGIVYKARDTRLNRVVALKMVSQGNTTLPEHRARLLREAKAIASLKHPNIVQIHEIGDLDGKPYFSLDFETGGSLARRLDGTPWPADRAATLVQTLAQAVDAAHQQHLIHRDLKPSNILFSADGTPKLSDFGLAKQLNADRDQTKSGLIVGTPSYMAPEQADASRGDIGAATDIYSLGVILYELLTGRPPFKSETAFDTMLQVLHDDPVPPLRLNPKLSRDLETICLKCLSKEPAGRYGTARDLAEDLRRTLAGEPIVARPARTLERVWRWCRRKPALAAAASVAILAGLVALITVAVSFILIRDSRDDAIELAKEKDRQRLKVEQLADDNARVHRRQALADAETARKQASAKERTRVGLEQSRQSRAALQKILKQPGGVHELLNQPANWQGLIKSSRAGWQQAKDAAADAGGTLDANWTIQLKTNDEEISHDEADFALAQRLEKIRLDISAMEEEVRLRALVDREYPAVFADAGLTVALGRQKELAMKIGQSPIKDRLVAALDHWAWVAYQGENDDLCSRLLEVARLADPDPWRDKVRDLDLWKKPKAMARLAEEVQADRKFLAQLSPQMFVTVGSLLSGKSGETWLRMAQELHPADFWINYELAAILDQNGMYVEAIEVHRIALAIRPNTAAAWTNLGVTLLRKHSRTSAKVFPKALPTKEFPKGFPAPKSPTVTPPARHSDDLAGAIAAFNKAIEIDPKNRMAWYNLGEARRIGGDVPGAIEAYKKGTVLYPEEPAFWQKLSHIYQDLKNLPAAIDAYKKALALAPEDAFLWGGLAIMLREQKDLPGARDACKRALALDPKNGFTWTSLGMIMRDQKDLPGAIDAYKKALALHSWNSSIWQELGLALHDQKDLPGAIDAYKKGLVGSPKDSNLWNNLGVAHNDRGDLPAAIDAYKKAAALNSNNARAWYNLGDAQRAQKNRGAAINAYNKALSLDSTLVIDPKNELAWYSLGEVLRTQKSLPSAIDAYKKALAIDPNFASAWNNLGIALHAQRNLPAAVDAYHKALSIDPKFTFAWNNLGYTLQAQNNLPAAIDAYSKAVALNPKDKWTWNSLGIVLRDQGDLPGAIDAYTKALDLDPKVADVRRNLDSALKVQALEKRLPGVLKGDDTASEADLLALADWCQRNKKRYRDAADLYAKARVGETKTDEAMPTRHRYNAACAAALAAAGKGIGAEKLDASEKARLRKQAQDWLQADLTIFKALPRKNQITAWPVHEFLRYWQRDSDLAGLRDEQELAQLPADERAALQKLWSEVDRLAKEVHSYYSETVHKGQLADTQREQTYPIKMKAAQGKLEAILTTGVVYMIEMESANFRTHLRLVNESGNVVIENYDTSDSNKKALITYAAPKDGVYRIVATSFEQRGVGAYTLTIREFKGVK